MQAAQARADNAAKAKAKADAATASIKKERDVDTKYAEKKAKGTATGIASNKAAGPKAKKLPGEGLKNKKKK